MRGAVGSAYVLTSFALTGIVVTALFGWLTGDTTPLWEGAVLGIVLGTGTIVGLYCEKQGWIKFGPPARFVRWKQRKSQLAQERDRIFADALARKEAQAHKE